jgi:hypothetical protein
MTSEPRTVSAKHQGIFQQKAIHVVYKKQFMLFITGPGQLAHDPQREVARKPHRDTGSATLLAWLIEGREHEQRHASFVEIRLTRMI